MGRASTAGAAWREVLPAFLRLGCTSFGGPAAHLACFRTEFVERRGWLDDHSYADLVAFCQFLPGPASSQVGIGLGWLRAGLPGACAAWLGFTLPSALVMAGLGMVARDTGNVAAATWLHGLTVVTVAVIAQALWLMGHTLCPDRLRASIAVAAATAVVLMPGPAMQIVTLLICAALGWRWVTPTTRLPQGHVTQMPPRPVALVLLGSYVLLLLALPLLAERSESYAWQFFNSVYRAGALVFGGGHVVLSLLQVAVVPPGWLDDQLFLAGYGAAQALPGPISTFAAYLGAASSQSPHGWAGALLGTVGIFLPSFLLVLGGLPWWDATRRHPGLQSALMGINAGVVGLLLATFYAPVWTSAIRSAQDFAFALIAFGLLAFWKTPPWLVVAGSALGGAVFSALGLA